MVLASGRTVWRSAGPYVPTNSSKAGLLDETREFLRVYAETRDVEATARQLRDGGLPQRSRQTRTPNEWIALDAGDEEQLLGATAQGRCLFTFNVGDFVALARRFPNHAGVVLAAQASWRLPELIAALDRLLGEAHSEEWVGAVRWLNDWRGE